MTSAFAVAASLLKMLTVSLTTLIMEKNDVPTANTFYDRSR